MDAKEIAARAAVEQVRDGMILGLGTGSTSRYAVMAIGEGLKAKRWKDLRGVPTSEATAALAHEVGIPLIDLHPDLVIDLAIDGADEVDPQLDLIKGLGGALLREKAVEARAKRFVVIVDPRKLVPKLGTLAPLPVEVFQGKEDEARALLTPHGCTPTVRTTPDGGLPYVTDNGNHILDCRFPAGIDDARALASALESHAEVVAAHGLFLGMATEVLVGDPSSGVRRLQR